MLLVDLADLGGRDLQTVERPEEPSIGLVAPPHETGTTPARGPERVEPPVVTNAGIGVPLDRVACEVRQIGPSLQAPRIARGDGSDRLPTTVRREGPGRVESGGQVRS